jgi:hypothetical protein
LFDKKFLTSGTKCRQKGKANPPSFAKSNKRRRSIHPKDEGVGVILGQVGSEAHLVKTKYQTCKLNEIKLSVK